MKNPTFALAILLGLAAARPAVAQQPVATPPVPALDAQFIDSTEYLIAPDELHWNGDYVAIGRQLALPSTSLHGGTQFLVVGQGAGWEAGDRAWANQVFRTRPATRADLSVGKPVFCFNENEGGLYRGPRSRTEALTSGWFATMITDVSTLDRNEVKAGKTRLGVSCLRVIM